MWRVDGECVAEALLRFIRVDPILFATQCFLCGRRPSLASRPPRSAK